MDIYWKPVALGKLGEFLKRIDRKTSRKDVLSAVDRLEIPPNLKKHLLSQLINRGIISAPAFTAWAQFSPEKSINFAMDEIRNFKES